MPQKALPGLAGELRPSGSADGDFCRPNVLHRHRLSGCELGVCGRHQRLSPDPPRIQCHSPVAQNGIRKAITGQSTNAFVIERESINKKTGKYSKDVAYGITSRTPEQANAQRVLNTNRFHWSIENSCHYVIDWNYDEDRNRISKGSELLTSGKIWRHL
ncbi:MAG: hypothetical protein V1844_07365, partial [Pseudomonadota bacterium]